MPFVGIPLGSLINAYIGFEIEVLLPYWEGFPQIKLQTLIEFAISSLVTTVTSSGIISRGQAQD